MSTGIIIVVIGIVVLTLQPKAEGKENMYNFDLDSIYKKWGEKYGVDWKLLKAIAIVESDETPLAENPADPSRGIMQILCKTNLKGDVINKFNVDNWPPPDADYLFLSRIQRSNRQPNFSLESQKIWISKRDCCL